MAYLFGAPPTRDLLLPPSARICNFMASFALRAAYQLDHLCSVPRTALSPNTTMLSYYYVVSESVSIRYGGMSGPPPSSLSLYWLERTEENRCKPKAQKIEVMKK